MIRLLASSILYVLANATGLIFCAILLPGFHIDAFSFLVSLLFFSASAALLGPFIIKISIKYIPAVSGGIALVTTFIGLILTSIFTNGLKIDDLITWLIAPFIIWLFSLIAGIILPVFIFKKTLANRKDN